MAGEASSVNYSVTIYPVFLLGSGGNEVLYGTIGKTGLEAALQIDNLKLVFSSGLEKCLVTSPQLTSGASGLTED